MDRAVDGHLTRRAVVTAASAALASLALGSCGRRQRWKPLSDNELNGPIETLPPRVRPSARPTGSDSIPGVLPRREWAGGGTIESRANPMNGVRRITIHHSAVASSGVRTRADAARMLESIRRGHVSQQWADIGYHYIIDPHGRIWEGRPIRFQGAHVKDNNEHNLGIMLMGNFEVERPTPAAISSLDAFVGEQMRRYNVGLRRAADKSAGVFTHQEIMSTVCPGRNLQGYMIATRSSSGRLARA